VPPCVVHADACCRVLRSTQWSPRPAISNATPIVTSKTTSLVAEDTPKKPRLATTNQSTATMKLKAVFANPNNAEARALQADALEQLGYQTESATWRNAYLMGALELRSGPKEMGASSSGPDTVRGMTNELLFDFIALRLNHEKTDGMKAAISMVFSDSNEVWALELSNSVLNNTKGRVLKNPDVTITLTRPAFLAMLLQGKKLPELVQAGMVKVEGNPQSFGAVVANIMNFDPVFNIVTP